MQERKNFLEGHLASALGRRKNVMQEVQTQRPSFPAPAKVESIDSDHHEEAAEGEAVPKDTTETAPSTYLGAGTASSTRTYIRTTKADDLFDYADDTDTWKEKVKCLADLIKQSKCLVIYTGAGISTSAKIPDYRSMTGIWTKLEKGETLPDKIDLEAASPTLAHMAVAELVKEGVCKLVVSTNIDGLHRRSGVDLEHIAELHGNCYREVCQKCGKEFLRTFSTIKDGQKEGHYTGRQCDVCPEGKLLDSIVNFGESLPERDFQLASKMSLEADLTLVIGSSMRVSPACNMPRQTVTKPSFKQDQSPGKMVLINKQKTPFEDEAWLHIFANIDEVLQELMQQLGLAIPTFSIEG